MSCKTTAVAWKFQQSVPGGWGLQQEKMLFGFSELRLMAVRLKTETLTARCSGAPSGYQLSR